MGENGHRGANQRARSNRRDAAGRAHGHRSRCEPAPAATPSPLQVT